jgi:hypothetical protein
MTNVIIRTLQFYWAKNGIEYPGGLIFMKTIAKQKRLGDVVVA